MAQQPLLSICIPTYNRSEVLKQCLDSIINNDYYSEKIEIVISDNASSDDTDKVGAYYSQHFPNVIYHRNEVNIGGDRNFVMALTKATGVFRKLHNDYLVFLKDGLKFLLDTVETNLGNKPLLFYNNLGYKKQQKVFGDFDSLVDEVGWGFSWIGKYGYWEEDFVKIPDKERKLELQFIQTDLFLRMFLEKKKCVIYTMHFMRRLDLPEKQGDYHFFNVHINNYLNIFSEYLNSGDLSQLAYNRLCKKVFVQTLPFYDKLVIEKRKQFSYTTNGAFLIYKKHFSHYSWFYPLFVLWICSYPIRKFVFYLKTMAKKILRGSSV